MSEHFRENETILHYKIISAIGKGGMGEVFLAQDTKLDRKVALKILPPEFAEDADRMSRFVREAKSASALNHPNIITIHEIGESDGTHFIATEFIDGKTLGDYAKANPLNYKSALEIAIQVASALDEAHSAGIVHRDIKPDNVMIRANGLVKILDFGIAKFSGHGDAETHGHGEEDKTLIAASPSQPDSASHKTSPGMIIGTANYMSPEQAKGKVVDARTDIFSFGVVLHEMIAGQLPFEGENALEMIGAILKDEPKPLNSEVPTEISKIINKCLRKDRDERYQTIKDVGNDLKDVKQELEFSVRVTPSGVNLPSDQATQILSSSTTAEGITPQGVTLTKSKYLAAGILTLLLAVGGFFGYKYLSPTTTQINSIAVLPFENKSSDADSEYLSDGLAESLIYRLSQLPDLKVSPTSSVFRYKGKETDPQIIAKELGVDSVMTGRITQRGENLTISVNLVDTRNGKSLWGEQYERKMSELLTTQREIASEITNKLQLKLSGAGEQKLTKKYTDNNEAYQLYLKGRFYWNKRDEENLRKAIEQFKAAAEKDPNFALAFVGLADCYALLPQYSSATSAEVLPQAKTFATRALEIDDSLSEAHASLGFYHSQSWNWAEAEKSFKRAIELNPSYATARLWFAQYLQSVGRYDEAEIELKRAIELEPLLRIYYVNLAMLYTRKGDLNAAIEQFQRSIELDANWYWLRLSLAFVYIKQGRNGEAIAEAEKGVELSKRQSISLGFLGYIYAKAGRKTDAIKVVEELKERYQKQQTNGLEIAYVYGGLGEKEQAFVWLEKEFQSRNQKLPIWLSLGYFDSLRDDPRYKDLLKRMGLPE
jgi:eukaryotic-like serine/threonine-protein kinase